MKPILINFSGHVLSSEAVVELRETYDSVIDAKPVEIVFDGSIEHQIANLVGSLPAKIDGSSAVTIIPPGQATFAILLVSYLHGVLGHFPNLCYLELASNGVYMPKTEYIVQPHEIRSAGRKFRFSHYDEV